MKINRHANGAVCAALAAIAFTGVGVETASAATVYSNTPNGVSWSPLGTPDTTSYGETFTLTQTETLNNLSFFASAGNAGNLELVVAAWNGTRAVGPAIYTSAVTAYAGGARTIAFNNVNTALTAGTYIAYMTIAGVSGAVSAVNIESSNTNGGLGGQFAYLNSNGVNPLTLTTAWVQAGASLYPDLAYVATFSTATPAVPVPGALPLLLSGLAALAAVSRTRSFRAGAARRMF